MPSSPIRPVIEQASRVILGKERQIRLALACLLARGHLLIEDLPGVGKTTLAQALARLLGLDFHRIQFTSDMLPADIIRVSIYDPDTMEGEPRPLPEPFFVIATQNPSNQIGTFPLPESQLDRFLMRIEIGYPGHDAERALLQGSERRDIISTLQPCLAPEDLPRIQASVRGVHASPALVDYIQALVEHTRRSPDDIIGLG